MIVEINDKSTKIVEEYYGGWKSKHVNNAVNEIIEDWAAMKIELNKIMGVIKHWTEGID